jgi:hypothetical protein
MLDVGMTDDDRKFLASGSQGATRAEQKSK